MAGDAIWGWMGGGMGCGEGVALAARPYSRRKVACTFSIAPTYRENGFNESTVWFWSSKLHFQDRESVRRGLSLAKQNSQSALPTEPQKSDQLCQAIQPGSWQGWPVTPSIQTRRGLYTASVKTFKKHLDKSHHNNPEWVKNQPKRSTESL